jgi:hypothetical protein
MPAFSYTMKVAASSRWFSRFSRVRASVVIDRIADSSRAPTVNARVMRARRPRRRVSGNRGTALEGPSGQTWSL